MNDPTGRVLQLLSLLQTYKFWPGAELAERLEVSSRTLRRDVERLRELGYPVDATPGVAGGYRLAAGAHVPPLVLDDDEAVAIAVGLRAAAGASVDGIEDTSLRALAKLEQVLPDRLRRRVRAVHANVVPLRWSGSTTPTVDAEALAVLAQGCRDREQVRFEYQARVGEETRRLVEPHQLVSAGRRWYLVAWDVRRSDWRTFRLDRLRSPQLAGVRFEPRELPASDAAAYVARSLNALPKPYEATIVVHGPATRCARSSAGPTPTWRRSTRGLPCPGAGRVDRVARVDGGHGRRGVRRRGRRLARGDGAHPSAPPAPRLPAHRQVTRTNRCHPSHSHPASAATRTSQRRRAMSSTSPKVAGPWDSGRERRAATSRTTAHTTMTP